VEAAGVIAVAVAVAVVQVHSLYPAVLEPAFVAHPSQRAPPPRRSFDGFDGPSTGQGDTGEARER
jgi:hypothetical protein